MQSRPARAGLARAYHLVTGQGRVVFSGIRIAAKSPPFALTLLNPECVTYV